MKILVEDLSPRRIGEIAYRMQPGRLSQSGFLCASDRLVKVIENDRKYLAKQGITHEQIADRLESLVGQATRKVELAYRRRPGEDRDARLNLWTRGIRMGRFELARDSYMGAQECPFLDTAGNPCEDISHGHCDFILWNHDAGLCLCFPGLAIHLIRDHHFFEGQVHHRVEPVLACAVLRLAPGEDYSPRWAAEWIWAFRWCTTESFDEWRQSDRSREFVAVVDAPEVVEPAGKRGRLYFRGDLCVAVLEGECRLPGDVDVRGALWALPHLPAGITGFRREEHRYIEPEESP